MAVKKVGSFNIHETPAINQNEFDVETYLNANWEKTKEAVNNNAEELMQAQKDISTLKEDNKTNKSSIDVLEKSNETRDEKISKNTEDIEAIQGSIKTATETINKKDNEQDEDIKANKETIKEIQAENERLRNDIKSIALPGEASGENIHLEDSSNARCEIEIDGNQKQETREGYNQIDIDDFFEGTRNGVTITKDLEKGSLTFNGTVTSTFAIAVPLSISKGTIVSYSLNNSKINKEVIMRFATATGTIGGLLCDAVDAKKENFELTEDINGVQIRIGAGITLDTFVIFPQLETNTSLHNFEIYGASPSIDYPSPVKSVGNDVNLLNPNTFNNVKGTSINDEKILIDTTSNTSNANLVVYNNISLEDDTYSIIAVLESGKYTGGNIVVRNADGQTIGEFLLNDGKKIVTGNIKDIVLWNVTNATNCILKIKISKGKETKGYSKFGMGSAKIDIFNKNFIDIDKLKSLNSRNAYEKYNNVECLKLAGVTQRYNLNCKQNTQYVFQVNIVGYTYTGKLIGQFLIAYTDGSASYMQTDGTNAGKYSLISKAGKTVKALVWNGYSSGHFVYIDKNDIQLDEATTLTNIVQHEEQSYLVDVQQPMFKGDTFIRQDGKWYEKHCVKTEIMLTFPTTNIEVCGTFANFQTNRNIAFAVVRDDLKITNVRNDILCDKLKAKDNSMWGGKEEGIQTYTNSNKFMISIPFEDIEKNFGEELTINNYSQAFRKYINDNPLKIYYKLAEPELIECTEAQSKVLDEIYNKAHTYKNITNILAESSEVNPIVNVKYLKDTETEHNKLQVQIDEIKQLLSSTETSALLVNNLEKDLRMEVE